MMSKKSTDIAIEKVSDVNDYFCDQYDFIKKLNAITNSNSGIHCFEGIVFDGSRHFIKKCSKLYVQQSNIDNPWNEINALQILSLIQSNHFPAFIKAIEDDQYICLISEYIDGMDLCTKIQQNKGGLEPVKAQKYLIQISHAIRELHDNNLAHMDVSPENVIIDKNDNIKLIDFGVCTTIMDDNKCEEKSNPNYSRYSDNDIDEKKSRDSETYHKHIASCTLPGKDGYRAPEIELRQACDPRLADAFSFGYMAWCVLCGNMPFESANPHNEIYTKFMQYGAREWSNMLCQSMNGWDTKQVYCGHEIPLSAIRMLDDLLQCNIYKRKTIDEVLNDHSSFLCDKIEEKRADAEEYKVNMDRNRVPFKSKAESKEDANALAFDIQAV